MAEQDVTLDVRVLGSGYDQGSKVDFLLDGTPTPKLRTNRTTFVSATEVVANITIAVDAVVSAYDVQVTTSRGKKGIGIDRFMVTVKVLPSQWPATGMLPVPSGADGLFADGQSSYPLAMSADGGVRVQGMCDQGRALVIDLPSAWAGLVAAGTAYHCAGGGGGWGALMGLKLVACPDGTSCPLGSTGHDPSLIGFQNDLRYFWWVTAPRPKGKGTVDYGYNVVWTNGSYRVTRWAGGNVNGTACEWQVAGSRAEFWRGPPSDLLRLDGGVLPMALDVVVQRTDDACVP
jgi:hypothetical protein